MQGKQEMKRWSARFQLATPCEAACNTILEVQTQALKKGDLAAP